MFAPAFAGKTEPSPRSDPMTPKYRRLSLAPRRRAASYPLALALLLAAGAAPLQGQAETAPRRQVTLDLLAGVRTFTDGTGMLAGEIRGAMGMAGWRIRPAVGLAGATDILGAGQSEIMLGVQGDAARWGTIQLVLGAGVSRLGQDGGEWNSGSSVGPYGNAMILWSPDGFAGGFGLDARYLAAPSFTRADGLLQEVRFYQIAVGGRVELGRR
jgi:hypothetical protein